MGGFVKEISERYRHLVTHFFVRSDKKMKSRRAYQAQQLILLLFIFLPGFPQSLAHKEKRRFIVFWADKYPQLCRMVADKP